MGILSILLLLPLAGILILAILPGGMERVFRAIALTTTLVQGCLALFIAVPGFLKTRGQTKFSLVEQVDWIRADLGQLGQLKITYFLGVDGLSLLMVVLTILISIVGVASSWKIDKRPKAYFMLFLLLNLSTVGVFMALDFFLFYLFYEFMLLPMFFLIGIWGAEKREYAAIKFFLYTLFGSVFMLLIMIGLGLSHLDLSETTEMVNSMKAGNNFSVEEVRLMMVSGNLPEVSMVRSFDMTLMAETFQGNTGMANLIPDSLFAPGMKLLGLNARLLAFIVLFVGFAIKIPAVPVHTWLPDAHVQAPTPISVVLAGILLKVGGYGIIRICYQIFPDGAVYFSGLIAGVGVVSILYAALVAMAQKDFKRLIAFSSVSHMGFVTLGIASLHAAGFQGSILQMFNHGIISAALFLIVGVLYDRFHDRKMDSYKGLWNKVPGYTTVVIISFAASFGLPGLSTFVSELLVLSGSFSSALFSSWWVVLAVFGILFSAAYYLVAFRKMFFGEYSVRGDKNAVISDLDIREWLMFIPLLFMMVLFGIFPTLLLEFTGEEIPELVEQVLETGQNMLSYRR